MFRVSGPTIHETVGAQRETFGQFSLEQQARHSEKQYTLFRIWAMINYYPTF